MSNTHALVCLVALLNLTGTVACKSDRADAAEQESDGDKSSAKEKKKAPAEILKASDVKWNKTELNIGKAKGKFFMTGSTSGNKDPLFMATYFDNFPEGTEVDVAGTKGTTDARGHLALDVDMRKVVGPLSLADASKKDIDLGVKIVIKAPGSETIEQKLPAMRIATAVGGGLAKVRDGALTFEGEPADDGKVTSVALVEAGSLAGVTVIGKAEKVWDVDWIAVVEKRESGRIKKCGGYEKIKGELDVEQVDSIVKIYDRRSGKALHEKTFQPKDECPSYVVASGNKAKAFVLPMHIEPWIRDALAKGK